VEGTDNLVTRVDLNGRLTFVNGPGALVFGLPPEACIGREALDFVHPRDTAATKRAFEEWLIGTEDHFTFENRQVSQDGLIHHMLWNISADRDEDGRTVGFSSIGRDITDRKQAEDDLNRQRGLIEQSRTEEQFLVRLAQVSLESSSLGELLDDAVALLANAPAGAGLEPRAAVLLGRPADGGPRLVEASGVDRDTLEQAGKRAAWGARGGGGRRGPHSHERALRRRGRAHGDAGVVPDSARRRCTREPDRRRAQARDPTANRRAQDRVPGLL
jgi:PAS domain S-box-containing protein